jgi:hypothetical protein
MDYAVANQRDRRNLTDAELASLVMAVDKRRTRGGDQKSEAAKSKAPRDAFDPKSAETTAELTSTSPRKVEKVRPIMEYAEKTGVAVETIFDF